MIEEENSSEFPKKKGKWKKIVIITGALLFVVWFLTPTGGIERPVNLKKDDNGKLQVVGEDSGKDGITFKAHAGVVNARNSTSTVSSTSHSDPGWFRAETLTILNQSDHLLMKRVGEKLLESLKAESNWEEVQYLPAGFSIEDETPASDLYMILNLGSIEKSGLLKGQLKAQVTATISNGLISSSHSVHDSLSPVTVQFQANLNLDHDSTLTGIESAGAKYSLQGAEIAKELAKTLQKQIDDIREKYSSPPQELNELFADYRPAPDLSVLGSMDQIATIHGVMIHNDTLWSLTIDADTVDFINDSSDLLQKQGWSEYSKQVDEHSLYLRMKNETKWLEIFPERRPFITNSKKNENESERWYVRYRERMSRKDLEQHFQSLLEKEPLNIDLLLALDRMATQEQRNKVYELAEVHPPGTAQGWLRLASRYAHKKEMDKFIAAMQSATVLSMLMEDRTEVKKKVENLIKKNKIDKEKVLSLTIEQFNNAGVQQLTADSPLASKKFQSGQPVAYVIPGKSPDKWTYFGARVSDAGDDQYRLSFFEGDQNGGHGFSSICCIDLSHERRHDINSDGNAALLKINKIEEGQFEAEAELLKD